MQKRLWRDEHLKSYCNHFCECEKSVLFEFFGLAKAMRLCESLPNLFSKEEFLEISRYVVLKNLLADCKDLILFSIAPEAAKRAMAEFGMNGKVVAPVQSLLSEGGGKDAYFVDDLLALGEGELSFVCERLAKGGSEIYIDFYRTLEQAGTLDNTYHKSPARVLEDFGLLDRGAYLVGCNFLDKDDANVLAGYKSHIILTPQADMMLGRGAVNVKSLLASGLDVKLGSGEYPFADMLEEGRLALGNTANLMLDPFALTKQQIEDMIVSNKDVDELLTETRFEKQKQIVEKIMKGIK